MSWTTMVSLACVALLPWRTAAEPLRQALDYAAAPADNPLPQGPPVRFANATQDRDAVGWLTLSTVACK